MSLLLITDGGDLRVSNQLVSYVEKALSGGQGYIHSLQLREQVMDTPKNIPANDLELRELIGELSPVCQNFKCKLILNKCTEFLKVNGVDGVHLGEHSDSIANVKDIKPEAIVGYSVHTVKEAVTILNKYSIIDYLMFGPVFNPISKATSRRVVGIEELKKICKQSTKPVFAVGGVNEQNIKLCKEAGAGGVASIGAIFQSKNPEDAVKRLIESWIN